MYFSLNTVTKVSQPFKGQAVKQEGIVHRRYAKFREGKPEILAF